MLAWVAEGMAPRRFPVRADVPGFLSFDSGRRDLGGCSRLMVGVGMADGCCKLLDGVFFGRLVIVGALDFGGDAPLARGGEIPDECSREGLLDVLLGLAVLAGEAEAVDVTAPAFGINLSAAVGLLALDVGTDSLAGLDGTDDVPCAVFPVASGRGGVAAARRDRVGVVTKLCCGSRESSSKSSRLKTAFAFAALTVTFRGVCVADGSSFFSSPAVLSLASASFMDFDFFFVDFFFLVGEPSGFASFSLTFFLLSFFDFSFFDESFSFFSFLGVLSFFANRLLRRGCALSDPTAGLSSSSAKSIVPLINASTFSSMVSSLLLDFSLLTAILIRCTK